MADLFTIIKTVDKDRNGYITNTEFDDILKLIYGEKFEDGGLKNTNVKPVIRQFASSANKVLIDYKQFRDCINEGLKNCAQATESAEQKVFDIKNKINNEKLSTKSPRPTLINNQIKTLSARSPYKKTIKQDIEKRQRIERKNKSIIQQSQDQLQVQRAQEKTPRPILADDYQQKSSRNVIEVTHQQKSLQALDENIEEASQKLNTIQKKSSFNRQQPQQQTKDLPRNPFENNNSSPNLFQNLSRNKNKNTTLDGLPLRVFQTSKELQKEIYRQVKCEKSGDNQYSERKSKLNEAAENSYMERPSTSAYVSKRLIKTPLKQLHGVYDTGGYGGFNEPTRNASSLQQIDEQNSMPTRNNVLKQHKTLNDVYKNQYSTGGLALFTGAKTTSYQNSTASTTGFNTQKNQFKDKLTPQWTQIYRKLHSKDTANQGLILLTEFEKVLHHTNTFLSRQDISAIKIQYGIRGDSNSIYGTNGIQIDYDQLSQDILGSAEKHHQKFDLMRKTHTRLNQLKQGIFINQEILKSEIAKQDKLSNGNASNQTFSSRRKTEKQILRNTMQMMNFKN